LLTLLAAGLMGTICAKMITGLLVCVGARSRFVLVEFAKLAAPRVIDAKGRRRGSRRAAVKSHPDGHRCQNLGCRAADGCAGRRRGFACFIGFVIAGGLLLETLLPSFVVAVAHSLLARFTRAPDALAAELVRSTPNRPTQHRSSRNSMWSETIGHRCR